MMNCGREEGFPNNWFFKHGIPRTVNQSITTEEMVFLIWTINSVKKVQNHRLVCITIYRHRDPAIIVSLANFRINRNRIELHSSTPRWTVASPLPFLSFLLLLHQPRITLQFLLCAPNLMVAETRIGQRSTGNERTAFGQRKWTRNWRFIFYFPTCNENKSYSTNWPFRIAETANRVHQNVELCPGTVKVSNLKWWPYFSIKLYYNQSDMS